MDKVTKSAIGRLVRLMILQTGVAEFSGVEGGIAQLKLSDGSVVSAKDVSLPADLAKQYKLAASYNYTAVAKAFLDGHSSYDGTIEAYAEEVKTAYLLGKEAGERGIGPRALSAFMEYYRTHGEWRFILRTWSGNKCMLRCAEKLGFLEIKRESDTHAFDDKKYEDVTLEKRF